LEDHGLTAWATVDLRPEVSLVRSIARRAPFSLTTVRIGLNFRLLRP
jgi:hypothetical protein